MRAPGAMVFLLALLLSGCGGDTTGEYPTPPGLKKVPRNRTMILPSSDSPSGQLKEYDSFNPFLPGFIRTGPNFLYEPLYYFNAYREKDNLIPWIATGHRYNADFTEVVITIRKGVEWSDGTPWTAEDVAFTVMMLKEHAPSLQFSSDMKKWVRDAVALSPQKVRIRLTAPNPRFVFDYFAYNFDNCFMIVPKHIWQGQDPKSFKNLDLSKGWPVVSGPYRVVHSSPQQRILDLREDWWAAKSGFHSLPKVERIIFLPGMDEGKRVQNIIANRIDSCLDLRSYNIKAILDHCDHVTTWTGKKPPYGYLDWWPICLGFNILEPPFNDPEVRHAINHAIDRRQLVEVGWQGSGSYSLTPFPEFPAMQRYTRTLAPLIEKYEIDAFNPAKTAEILTRKGWRKDARGFWEKDGKRFKVVIDIFDIFQDIAPVLIAQLQKAGFDASFRMTADGYTRMTQGTAMAFMFGNGGGVRDPYFTLNLYHGRHCQPTGTATYPFWRFSNPEFDRIVDAMGRTRFDDPAVGTLLLKAMDIWYRELPAIPLVQWYHRIPHNETYWTNWPSEENPYINSAFWHRTFLLVLLNLRPAQERPAPLR